MREIPFSTPQEIFRNLGERSIVLFGAGNIAEKTNRLLGGRRLAAIVDNAKNLWGVTQLGVEVLAPDFLATDEGQDSLVIICTTSFSEVTEQVVGMGFSVGENVFVSPILNDLRIIEELENIKRKLLFTSGSPKQESERYGGGIYELSVNGDEWTHRKVYSGNCYGLIQMGETLVSVDTEKGMLELDGDYNVLRTGEIPAGTRAHGIGWSEITESFYVVGGYRDAVLVLDKDFVQVDTISISRKFERSGEPQHHCNDCLVVGESLFVSMFSLTGNWKRDIFDGVVLEIDLVTKEVLGPVISGLWMPHSIKLIDGGIQVLDSLPGHLRGNNAQVIGDFPAFTRGLDHDGVFYFIGQSRNRNYSKNLGISNNVSIDAGVIVFDAQTKASRFLQLPPKVSEIHSIVLL